MRSILHVDMDAFYASIEQLDHPEYKGKPVIVGADPKGGQGRGVVAACSYEARTFGVRSALPISRAWKLCPEGVYVRPRMKRYVEVSAHVMEVFRRYTDLVEPVSIDEAFLDITGSAALLGRPDQIALSIKKEIHQTTGLTASVGLAPNKFLAKIASDLRKPDGLVVVQEKDIQEFLHGLPISRLWGVGPKTEQRLREMGFHTIGQLTAASGSICFTCREERTIGRSCRTGKPNRLAARRHSTKTPMTANFFFEQFSNCRITSRSGFGKTAIALAKSR